MEKVIAYSLLTEFDIALFQAGKHFQLYRKLGSHLMDLDGRHGAYFAVWAPNAKLVSVTGNFNNWQSGAHELLPRWDKSGIWEGFIPGVVKGDTYKYHIHTATGIELDKGDPYALRWETPPRTGSMVWSFDHQW